MSWKTHKKLDLNIAIPQYPKKQMKMPLIKLLKWKSSSGTPKTNQNNRPSKDEYDWETLAEILGSSKEECETINLSDHTLLLEVNDWILHDAISLGAPEKVLILIARRFPGALAKTDSQGRYPIHVACASGSPPNSFIRHCLNMCPSSAAAKDVDGTSPIDLLCQS